MRPFEGHSKHPAGELRVAAFPSVASMARGLRWAAGRRYPNSTFSTLARTLGVRQNGLARTVARGVVDCLGKSVSGCVELPIALAVYPINLRLGNRITFRALRKIWWSAGTSAPRCASRRSPIRGWREGKAHCPVVIALDAALPANRSLP